MNPFLTIFCCLAFATVCPAQMLRFESNTVFSYSGGVWVTVAQVDIPSSKETPINIVPLAQLSPIQRSQVSSFLSQQSHLIGYEKIWSDEEDLTTDSPTTTSTSLSGDAPLQWEDEPSHPLRKAGSSLIVATCIGPVTGFMVSSMTKSGNYSGAVMVAVLGGISYLASMIRAGSALIQASEEISVE
jgi:hypothetical protein